MMPTGRWGSPADAARLIGLVCLEDASWITGQVIDAYAGAMSAWTLVATAAYCVKP
jgi:NAD(P)-dependent dehydrogenase (short-subunit alcohol dehydrogenase family)